MEKQQETKMDSSLLFLIICQKAHAGLPEEIRNYDRRTLPVMHNINGIRSHDIPELCRKLQIIRPNEFRVFPEVRLMFPILADRPLGKKPAGNNNCNCLTALADKGDDVFLSFTFDFHREIFSTDKQVFVLTAKPQTHQGIKKFKPFHIFRNKIMAYKLTGFIALDLIFHRT